MSEASVDVLRRVFEAFNDRDRDALAALFEPESEFIPILARLEGRSYRGPQEMLGWLDDIEHDWEVFETCPEEFRDLGERVLALGSWRARGRASGVELDNARAAWLVEIRNGRVWRWETFTDREAALRAAGVQPS